MLRKFATLLLLLPLPAFAYVRTVSDSGLALFWASPSVTMLANPSNSSGLSEAQVNTMLGQAFAAWSGVAGTQARATVSVSTSYAPASAPEGRNSIYFASRAGRRMDYGVIAMTEV